MADSRSSSPDAAAPARVLVPPDLVHAVRTELADLACSLELQGRRDAADVVMMLDGRLCEIIAAVHCPPRPGSNGEADNP